MTNNKWNQWKQKELRDGKTDDVQLHALIGYLKATHQIPNNRLKKDWFIRFDPADYRTLSITDFVSNQQMTRRPPAVIHRPDIMILDKKLNIKPMVIIELDGGVHHTAPGTKKTAKRNKNYSYAEIPLIVIDIMDLKELGLTWFEYLDQELAKLKIEK